LHNPLEPIPATSKTHCESKPKPPKSWKPK
jgi:hypothetical protein